MKSQNSKIIEISRRKFLRGIANGVPVLFALPFLEIMLENGGKDALGASGNAKRFVLLFFPDGTYCLDSNGVATRHPAWNPTALGKITSSTLPYSLTPFSGYESYLNVYAGLSNIQGQDGWEKKGSDLKDDIHKVSVSSYGTCMLPSGRDSIDQMIANAVGGGRSLVLSIDSKTHGADFDKSITRKKGVVQVAENRPAEVFRKIFGTLTASTASATLTQAKTASPLISPIDFILEDAKQLKQVIGYQDKQKLEEYINSVAEIHKRINGNDDGSGGGNGDGGNGDGGGSTSPSCESPQSPASGIPAQRDVHTKLMMDLIALAFQCDRFRVASLVLADAHNTATGDLYNFLAPRVSDPVVRAKGLNSCRHDLGHNCSARDGLLSQHVSYVDGAIREVSKFDVEMMVYLMKKLKGIQDSSGEGLLESTIMHMGSNMMGGPNDGHSMKNLPTLTAGRGGSLTSKMGNHLSSAELGGKSLTLKKLYVTYLRAFGISSDFNGESESLL